MWKIEDGNKEGQDNDLLIKINNFILLYKK